MPGIDPQRRHVHGQRRHVAPPGIRSETDPDRVDDILQGKRCASCGRPLQTTAGTLMLCGPCNGTDFPVQAKRIDRESYPDPVPPPVVPRRGA